MMTQIVDRNVEKCDFPFILLEKPWISFQTQKRMKNRKIDVCHDAVSNTGVTCNSSFASEIIIKNLKGTNRMLRQKHGKKKQLTVKEYFQVNFYDGGIDWHNPILCGYEMVFQ